MGACCVLLTEWEETRAGPIIWGPGPEIFGSMVNEREKELRFAFHVKRKKGCDKD